MTALSIGKARASFGMRTVAGAGRVGT